MNGRIPPFSRPRPAARIAGRRPFAAGWETGLLPAGGRLHPNFSHLNPNKWLVVCPCSCFDYAMNAGSHCADRGQAFLPENIVSWSRWDRLKARLHEAARTAIATCAPLGYEDEAGFHFGFEPAPAPAFTDPAGSTASAPSAVRPA
jgi:hypothetical protein